jgi:S1-C subfamily serine protease
VVNSRKSVLKVRAFAPGCDRRIEGTGFVYAEERLMTNAHVVAGARDVRVVTDNGELDGTVVVYDPERDLAVIYVPGLRAPDMSFVEKPAGSGASAIVLGYPLDGPYNAQSARISDMGVNEAPNIYETREVRREIYTIRSLVRSGNSGGPLITPSGRVLGVIFAAAADDRNVGFALTAREASGVADAGEQRTRGVRTGDCA